MSLYPISNFFKSLAPLKAIFYSKSMKICGRILVWVLWCSLFWGKATVLWAVPTLHPVYSSFVMSIADVCALIVGIVALVYSVRHQRGFAHKTYVHVGTMLAALALALLVTFWAWTPLLHLLFLLRFLWWGWALWGLWFLIPDWRRTSIHALYACLSVEVLLALMQVLLGHSVGVGVIGEPLLGLHMYDVAKMQWGDLLLLRGYGTLPHPNVLAGWLLLGVALLPMAIIHKLHRKVLGMLLGIGVLATGSKLGLLGLCFLYLPYLRRSWALLWGGLLLPLIFLGVVLSASTGVRALGLWDGMVALVQYPLGVGFGAVISAIDLTTPYLRAPWELQPPHSTPLYLAVVVGLPAMLLLMLGLFRLWKHTWRYRTHRGYWAVFLLFFFFEHFYVSLWQGTVLCMALLVLLWNTGNEGATKTHP